MRAAHEESNKYQRMDVRKEAVAFAALHAKIFSSPDAGSNTVRYGFRRATARATRSSKTVRRLNPLSIGNFPARSRISRDGGSLIIGLNAPHSQYSPGIRKLTKGYVFPVEANELPC